MMATSIPRQSPRTEQEAATRGENCHKDDIACESAPIGLGVQVLGTHSHHTPASHGDALGRTVCRDLSGAKCYFSKLSLQQVILARESSISSSAGVLGSDPGVASYSAKPGTSFPPPSKRHQTPRPGACRGPARGHIPPNAPSPTGLNGGLGPGGVFMVDDGAAG